jgi:hypothetical protein
MVNILISKMNCHPERSEGSVFLHPDARILRQPTKSRSFAALRMTTLLLQLPLTTTLYADML